MGHLTVWLSALVGLLACANALEVGKEYKFNYTGRMFFQATVMPKQNPFSAFRSTVRVQKLDDTTYAMKIEDMEAATSIAMDTEDFQKAAFVKNPEYSAMVERPFTVHFKPDSSGRPGFQFDHMEIPAEDALYSVNIKKGLASLVNIFIPEGEEHTYISDLSTIHGDCRAYWNIQHNPHWTNADAKVLNLSRVINFEECTSVPYKAYGFLGGSPCTGCEETKMHPLQGSSTVMYNFVSPTGDRKNMVLESAKAFSKVTQAPYTENGNVVHLKTIQSLTLLETTDVTEKLAITGEKQTKGCLNMEFEQNKDFKRTLDMKERHDFVEDWGLKPSEDLAIKLMKDLADLKMPSWSDDQVGIFKKKNPSGTLRFLLYSLHVLDYAQTEKVFEAIVKAAPEDQQVQRQKLFVESVTSGGYNPGLQFIMDKITSGEIDTRFIHSFVHRLRNGILEPTQVVLQTLLNFCESDLVKKFPQERLECILSYTMILKEICRIPRSFSFLHADQCKNGTLEIEAFDKLVPKYEEVKTASQKERQLYVHIAANLKTANAAKFLTQMIEDKDVDSFDVMDAIRALMQTLPEQKDTVQKVAAEIYLNQHNRAEHRMLAFLALLKTNPPLSLLHAMVGGLRKEKSDQVLQFVVSAIRSIDGTGGNMPCVKPLWQHLRYIVDDVAGRFPSQWKRKDALTSHFKMWASYKDRYDFGGVGYSSVIMGDSYLPREVTLMQGDYFSGFFFNSLGLTIRQQGLERMADFAHDPRTFGSKFGKNLWNFAGKRRLARDAASVKQEQDKIESTLGIHTKEYDPMRLEMTLQTYGHDHTVISLNETHFAPFVSPEYTHGTMLNNILSHDVERNTLMNARNFAYMLTTSTGVPAYFEVMLPMVVSYRRKDSSFAYDKDQGSVKLKLNHHLIVDASLEEAFGFAAHGAKKYLGVSTTRRFGFNCPLNLDVDANIPARKISFNKDFKLPRDILDASFRPYTFVYDFEDQGQHIELPLFKDEELIKKENEEVITLLGVKIKRSSTTLPKQVVRREREDFLYNSNLAQKIQYIVANPHWNPHKLHLTAEAADASDPVNGRILTVKHKMTPPEATERPKSSFKEFQEDLPKSFVHVVNVVDELKGGTDRRAELELRYSYVPERTDHWFQVFFEKTPFTSAEKERTKMCMVAKVKQTTTDWTKLNKEEVHKINDKQNIGAQIQINYGKDCSSGAEIKADIGYEHSDQQKEWLAELPSGKGHTRVGILRNPYLEFYQKCTEWLGKGMVMPFHCHKFIVHTSQLNKMKGIVTFNEHVKPHPIATTLMSIVISKRYPHLQYLIKRNTTERTVKFESVVQQLDLVRHEADITLVGPTVSAAWSGVPVSHGAHWTPKTATHLGMTNLQSYSRKWYHRYCDHQLNSVRTFDRAIYELPESDCWKVLAKDCSPQKIFTLLTKGVGKEKKDIKLLVDTHSVEIKYNGDKLTLVMDGAEEELVNLAPKIVKNEHGHVEMIIMNKQGLPMIDSPIYGLYVLGVDSSVFVQAAPYYRGKLCGLCGNFNLDRQHEFHTTDGCHQNTPWAYARNFVLPDGQCKVPEPDTNAGIPHCPLRH